MASDAAKMHCRNGHELFGDNVRADKYGRHCRTCAIERDRNRYTLKRKR